MLRPIEQAIWTGQALAPESPLYNMAMRFDILGPLDPARFAAAFDAVAQKTQVLGRVHAPPDGAARMAPPQPFPPMLDFSREADPEKAAQTWCAARAARPLTLERSTWDSCLIRLAAEHWVWFFCQHHIATDVTSCALIFEAVAAAYAGEDAALSSFSPPAASAETEAFWKGRAEPALMAAPYRRSRQGTDPASLRHHLELDAEISGRLLELAARPGFRSISPDLSRFTLIAALFGAFLSRITDQSRISFGTPITERMTPEARRAPGCHINLFPLAFEVGPQDSLESLVGRAQAEALTLLRHARPPQNYTELGKGYHAVLNYIPLTIGDFAGHPTRAEWLHPGAHDAGHDLRLHVHDFAGTGALTFAFDLNAALFDRADAPMVLGQFEQLLRACLSDPARPLTQIPLGPETLEGASAPQVPSIFDALDAQDASAPAITQGDARLTYGALRDQIAAVAGGCAAAGVQKGDAVLVHGTRSADLVAAFWGVMRAGAVAVPVPAHTPEARLALIAKASGARAIWCGPGMSAPEGLTRIAPGAPRQSAVPALSDPAYAIFTSGSTGTPKGVLIDHAGLADYAFWAAREHPGDHALHSSIGFDLTITALVAPFLTGHALRVYPETGETDLAVLDVFAEDAVDVVKLTPSHLALVLAEGRRCTRISTLILGGEALPRSVAAAARAMGTRPLTIANEYGPTEAVVGAMLHRFDPARDTEATISIGRPADGVKIAVRGASGAPQPPGLPGEIEIAGRLATGYMGQPDLTDARFVTRGGARWYRTGDLGRIEPDGRISYLGRMDDQLKIGGMRVEPAEIEAVLGAVPGVEAVHVRAHSEVSAFDMDAPACASCGLSSATPGADLDATGTCRLCRDFTAYKDRADVYFEPPEALDALIGSLKARRKGRFDAIMLLSGGKDSTYALYRLAERTEDILCLTLDNGFISEEAKHNIRAVARDLGLEHRFMTTPAMNAIFRDSLDKHANVCQGCFKTIYTLALRVARDEGIPAIATGLSRGQFFETRLTPELFQAGTPSKDGIEAFVAEARRAYHSMDDAVAQHLGTEDLADPAVLDDVTFIDIYRYIDVPVSEIYRYLEARSWARPADTGRSTNCRINDLGIFVHTRRKGFHNYAIPYSWDVRMGHKTREEAMAELRDDLDAGAMTQMMHQIGLDPERAAAPMRPPRLVAYVSGDAATEDLDRAAKAALLPGMRPTQFIKLERIPLTPNGKVDAAALPAPGAPAAPSPSGAALEGPTEMALAKLFERFLGISGIGAKDNFYDMGGDSIAAIRIALAGAEEGLAFEAVEIFSHQSIAALAALIDSRAGAEPAAPAEPLVLPGDLDLDALARSLGQGGGA